MNGEMQVELRMLYVAMTRCRYALYMLELGNDPKETKNFPTCNLDEDQLRTLNEPSYPKFKALIVELNGQLKKEIPPRTVGVRVQRLLDALGVDEVADVFALGTNLQPFTMNGIFATFAGAPGPAMRRLSKGPRFGEFLGGGEGLIVRANILPR